MKPTVSSIALFCTHDVTLRIIPPRFSAGRGRPLRERPRLAARASAGLLEAFQANALEQRRAQTGATPIVTTKLTDRLALLSGPGGNVVAFHGPDGLIVVDGFVKPAWPKLKAALEAVASVPIK